MTDKDIRRARLAQLIRERYDDKQSVFVARTGQNQSEISGLLKAKSFGEKKARSIELICGLPSGWLDGNDAPEGSKVSSTDTYDDVNIQIVIDMLRATDAEGRILAKNAIIDALAQYRRRQDALPLLKVKGTELEDVSERGSKQSSSSGS